MVEIKTFSSEVLFGAEVGSVKLCLEAAVRAGVDLAGADLAGADLVGANLVGANLVGASMVGASMEGADLEGASMEGANLVGANLVGASMEGADLEGARLAGARLEGARMEGAKGIRSYGPLGNEGRIIFAVKWEDRVMFQIGCFWGPSPEAKKAVAAKYGQESEYYQAVCLMEKALEGKK